MFRLGVVGLMAAAVSVCLTDVRAGGSGNCQQLAAQDSSKAPAEGELIVHEWGTFTTFSGSDGVFLDFRLLANEVSDLPEFVFDRANRSPIAVFSKKRLRGRVRMETPVTYFYTDDVREIRVRVDFPKGLLTEFYPPVQKMLPKFDAELAYGEGEPLGNSSLDWGTVTLIPPAVLAPNLQNNDLRNKLVEQLAAGVVPPDHAGGHYAQARATDSALVAVQQPKEALFGSEKGKLYMEKFLFYRGVGKFDLPLKAVFDDSGELSLANVTEDPISASIRIDVQGDQIVVSEFGAIDAGEKVVSASTAAMNLDQLSDRVAEILVAEGLYKKEAASMVETWKGSWFGEEGSRVLYIVPPRMTDELLPLTVEPVPDETLRILVGRMELMSPGLEREFTEAVRASSQQRTEFDEVDENKGKAFPISASIRRMGRMTEPALVRVSKIAQETSVRREAELLIAQLRSD